MRDVTYCTMENIPLKMDIHYPLTGNGPWPVVIYVHSGSWISGNKLDPFGEIDVPALTAAGYMTISVMYRIAPEHPFPAQIEDVKCAVRYLRAHAADYNLDSNRIGARGASAGAHLVALLALTDESAGWDVGEYPEYSSRVQAVVDMFGPSDFLDDSAANLSHETGILFGAQQADKDQLKLASPTTYITPDDPPILIIHGDMDSIVDLKQSELFFNALAKAGVHTELVVVQNGEHEFVQVGADFTTPTREQITQIMVEFFDKYLKAPL
jgi:acetyl esterase/lipase